MNLRYQDYNIDVFIIIIKHIKQDQSISSLVSELRVVEVFYILYVVAYFILMYSIHSRLGWFKHISVYVFCVSKYLYVH